MAFTGNYLTDAFKAAIAAGTLDFSSSYFKVALYTNSATLNNTTAAYTSSDEVVASGYIATGQLVSPTYDTENGIFFLTFTDPSWVSSLTARGALVYTVSGPSICVLDFGADRTSTTSFRVVFPPATVDSALIRLTAP